MFLLASVTTSRGPVSWTCQCPPSHLLAPEPSSCRPPLLCSREPRPPLPLSTPTPLAAPAGPWLHASAALYGTALSVLPCYTILQYCPKLCYTTTLNHHILYYITVHYFPILHYTLPILLPASLLGLFKPLHCRLWALYCAQHWIGLRKKTLIGSLQTVPWELFLHKGAGVF